MHYILVLVLLSDCLLSGPGTLSSDWPEQSCQSIQTNHQELIREGNVWQSQSKIGIGQSRPPRHQPQRKPQWGKMWLFIYYLELLNVIWNVDGYMEYSWMWSCVIICTQIGKVVQLFVDAGAAALEVRSRGFVEKGSIWSPNGWRRWGFQVLRGRHWSNPSEENSDHHDPVRGERVHICKGRNNYNYTLISTHLLKQHPHSFTLIRLF